MPTKTKTRQRNLRRSGGSMATTLKAKWESLKQHMRIPTLAEIQTLKKRVHDLEKKIP